MMLRAALWFALLAVAFWTDVFLLPSAGMATALSLSVVTLCFAARGLHPEAAALLGGALGMMAGMAGTGSALAQAASGALAGFVTSWLARAYVSHRSLLSAAATSFLCAALFWSPTVASAAADAVRGAAGGGFGAALLATVLQAFVAAAVSFPLLLLQRGRDARIRRGSRIWG